MKILCLFAVPLLCFSAFAQTSEVVPFIASGNSFVRDCSVVEKEQTTAAEDTASAACVLYVAGILRGAELGSSLTRLEANDTTLPKLFCRPDNVESGQVAKIVLKFVRENPEKANEETALLVMRALVRAFPCPSKDTKP
jgi:Rap1a immunity proteins